MEDRRRDLEENIAIQAINSNKIYVYTVRDLNQKRVNEGWLKVGQTIRLTDDRVREHTHTAGLTAEILFETDAQDIRGNVFSDHDIHNVLVKKGLSRKEGLEWFTKDGFSDAQLIEVIRSVVESRINCTDDFEQLRNAPTQFKLRPNQQRAVDVTYERWQAAMQNINSSRAITQFLWNAKPRFGKTLTAYEFAKKIQAKKVLIVTQRTAVSDSWHKDFFNWVMDSTNYKFGSSKENQLKRDGRIIHTAINKSESERLARDSGESLIFYISFADIKGKKEKEFKSKNRWVFDTNWDLFIVDETHEGSETDKAVEVFDNLNTAFTLHLSGTPFKKIYSKDFNEKNTYTWSYSDEQASKQSWDYTNGDNPYAEMPRLSIFTYQLSPELRRICMSDEYSFDFAEFFKNDKYKFIHEIEIKQFLDNLAAEQSSNVLDDTALYYPFADSRTREQLRHTFWLLPQYGGVKMCELLKKILKSHEYFKQYDVIMAAGSGDKDRAKSDKALHEVHSKIGDKPWETKTITLSCGQLTTGVTVAPWTATLMLNNLTSPAPYLQAAFRAQNPWRYEIDGEIYNKTECYVFDFAPDRILKIVDDYANLDVTRRDEPTRKNNIKKLINHLSVLSLDRSGKMTYLDAADVLEMPHYYDAKDIVDNGFMNNKLFSIGNIFSLPKDKREQAERIINQLEPFKNKKIRKNQPEAGTDNPELPENIRISESPLGERQYEIFTTGEGDDDETIIVPESKISEILLEIDNDGNTSKSEQLKKALKEIEQEKSKVKTEEEKQRDRLRGFSRTIPMFLMAYGKNTTTLANFDEFVNKEVFEELAGISREDFRMLRDDCQFFNEPRFNAAIKEFLERKSKLKDYYKAEDGDDIFDYIPPQATSQIFTPKRVVNMQLDMLENANPLIFKSPHNTFFDPHMKSGQYITEIAKRLYRHSRDKNIERILTTQLYGLAPTKILTDITHEMIFGFAELKEKKKYQKNFVERNLISKDANGNAIIDQDRGLKNVVNELWGANMKFTAIVGNPPYDNGNGQQIYTDFYLAARQVADNICMIFPIGWQEPRTANNLGKLNNQEVKADPQIVKIDNLQNAFPKITGAEWTNIILWRRGHDNGLDGKQWILTNGGNPTEKQLIWDKNDIEKPTAIVELTRLITSRVDFRPMQSITSAPKPYGLRTDFLKDPSKYQLPPVQNVRIKDDDIELWTGGRSGRVIKYVPASYPFPKITDALHKYKVLVPYAWGNWSETAGLGGAYSDIIIASPNVATTETWQESGIFEDFETAQKHAKFLMTRFARALLYSNKHSQHSTTAWGAVPIQDYSEQWWDESISDIDIRLMDKYGISEEVRAFVFKNIQQKFESDIVNYRG